MAARAALLAGHPLETADAVGGRRVGAEERGHPVGGQRVGDHEVRVCGVLGVGGSILTTDEATKLFPIV